MYGRYRCETNCRCRSEDARIVDTGGRALLCGQSYAGAALETLARHLGVTRGAIYHHFASKRGLFAAVVEHLMGELRDRIVAASEAQGHGWPGLRAGCDVFIEAAAGEPFRRIVLLDAPAVLGWDGWKAIDDRTTARSLRQGLGALTDQGELATDDIEALTAALSGSMNELALWIAAHPSPDDALARSRILVHRILAAFQG